MRKVILKINPDTKIIEDIAESYMTIPSGYEEKTIDYPPDIMGGYYKFLNEKVVKDETLYEQWVKNQEDVKL